GCDYEVMGDRIQAGTYLAAAFATGGEVQVDGMEPEHLDAALLKFEEAGARIERGERRITLIDKGRPRGTDVTTAPFPGFPTDMQAQSVAAMAVADGASLITETIFENRFRHVAELLRLAAGITTRGKSALARGKERRRGAPLMATDLRASASLIICGLCAE